MDNARLVYDLYEPEIQQPSDKTPIILCHGQGFNKYIYRHVAQKLSNEIGTKVYVPDGRNHGENDDYEEMSYDTLLKDGIQGYEAFQFKRVTIVSHSSSSIIAHAFALLRPDIMEKLVMVDHLPFAIDYQRSKDIFIKYSSYQNHFLKLLKPNMTLKAAREKIISFAPPDKKGAVAFHEKIAFDLIKKDNVFTWRHSLDSQVSKDYMNEEKGGGIPPKPTEVYNGEILCIRCENSSFVTDADFEEAKILNPKLKLLTFEDTTHLLLFEKTDEFVREVKKFLEDNSEVETK